MPRLSPPWLGAHGSPSTSPGCAQFGKCPVCCARGNLVPLGDVGDCGGGAGRPCGGLRSGSRRVGPSRSAGTGWRPPRRRPSPDWLGRQRRRCLRGAPASGRRACPRSPTDELATKCYGLGPPHGHPTSLFQGLAWRRSWCELWCTREVCAGNASGSVTTVAGRSPRAARMRHF